MLETGLTLWPADQPLPPHLPTPFRTTIRYLLTNELDIASVPRLSFFEWLAYFSEGDMQEKLREFCSPAGQVRENGSLSRFANAESRSSRTT